MEDWLIHRGKDLVATPWRNGLGTTRDVHTVLDGGGALLWQVSIADLERDAPFSAFPHCDRVFTPIAGDPPPELAIDGAAFAPCPLLVPKPFPGDVPTLSRIPAPGRAFNAIADRRRFSLAVSVRDLAPGETLPLPPAAELVLYCHSGALALGSERLEPGDAARGTAPTPVSAALPSRAILVAVHPAR